MKLNQDRWIYIILFTLACLVYSNTLNHGYVLDDFSVIKENVVVKQGTEGIGTIFKTHYRYGYGYQNASLYRPLTLTLFALQWEIAPDNPSFAHWFNVLGYGILIVLLFIFLNQLFGEQKKWLVFIACGLFALHPIHTEVVANIKSMDEIMAFSFVLLSLRYFLFHFEKNQLKHLIISLAFFTLAYYSKESTITFLAVFPLCLILFRQASISSSLLRTLPYMIPTVIYLISRKVVLGSLGGNGTIAKIDNLLMNAPSEAIKLATAIKIMGLYLWKLVFPHPLMNDYSFDQIQLSSFGDIYVWASILAYALLIYILVVSWKKAPIITFSIAFYLIGMSLYSNLVFTIGTSFGERLLFIPSLGFCLILAYFICKPFEKGFKPAKFWQSAFKPLVIVSPILLLYGFKTMDRNQAWKDNYTLYSTDVENCSRSARCQYYYGLGLMKEKAMTLSDDNEKQKLILEAIEAFNQSLSILPTYADAFGQRGLAYFRLNNYQAALADYQKAIEYSPYDANTLSNMGSLYFRTQQYQLARNAYERAIQANPNHVDALANLGSTLGTLGEFNSAITYFKRASALKPNEPNYYQMIGMTYQNMQKPGLAQPYLQKAQQLRNGR